MKLTKKRAIICLDFDDCILEHPNYSFIGMDKERAIKGFKENLDILRIVADKIDADFFITSSWYSSFQITPNNKLEWCEAYLKDGSEPDYFPEVKDIFNSYLDTKGLSCGNRLRDIRDLSKEYEIVVALDDMEDLFDKVKDIQNVCMLEVYGKINYQHLWKLEKFLIDRKYDYKKGEFRNE